MKLDIAEWEGLRYKLDMVDDLWETLRKIDNA